MECEWRWLHEKPFRPESARTPAVSRVQRVQRAERRGRRCSLRAVRNARVYRKNSSWRHLFTLECLRLFKFCGIIIRDRAIGDDKRSFPTLLLLLRGQYYSDGFASHVGINLKSPFTSYTRGQLAISGSRDDPNEVDDLIAPIRELVSFAVAEARAAV